MNLSNDQRLWMDCGKHSVEYIRCPWPNRFGSVTAAGLSIFKR